MLFSTVLCLLLVFSYSEAKPGLNSALVYLSQYGYLLPNEMSNTSQINRKIFKKSLKEFQEFAGVPVTGKLDKYTLEVMSMPRCGMKDRGGATSLFGKYVREGSHWSSKNLRYRITKYSQKLGQNEVNRAIQSALNLWSKYTDLTFEPTTGRANIDIRFEEGRHGDNDPFDGPSGTLAHAYFPQYGGATHFDDAEQWTLNQGNGINLYQVAAHEFGHALGLSHSQIKQALMAPFYKQVWGGDLDRDDIEGIQKIYGSKAGGGGGGNGGGGGGNGGRRGTGGGNGRGGWGGWGRRRWAVRPSFPQWPINRRRWIIRWNGQQYPFYNSRRSYF